MKDFVKDIDNLTVLDISAGNTEVLNLNSVHKLDSTLFTAFSNLMKLQSSLDVIISPQVLRPIQVVFIFCTLFDRKI